MNNEASNTQVAPGQEQKRILLIEDDSFISQMYSLKFKQTPFKCLLAQDGQEGMRLVKEEKPDLILLDIILPKEDGFAILGQLKGDPATKDIPVVLLTNLGQQENIQKGMGLGAVDYIIKAHHTPQDVVTKVSGILK